MTKAGRFRAKAWPAMLGNAVEEKSCKAAPPDAITVFAVSVSVTAQSGNFNPKRLPQSFTK